MKRSPHLLQTFPRATNYTSLCLPPVAAVHETASFPREFPYSERHLQCVWFDCAWRPPQLTTTRDEPVIVVDPGRWNLEAGPDFLDAVLTVGSDRRQIRGDVEIHIHPNDWKSHQHASDAAYARVAAHVTYSAGSIPESDLPAGAVQIPLRAALATNPAFSFDAIDLTAYPYAALSRVIPPCRRIMADWSPDRRGALLASAGEERLRLKSLRIRDRMDESGPEQVLYEEVMSALGYKHNRTAFRDLASRVPVDSLREESGADPLKAYSLLLGVAGLIPAKPSPRWDSSTREFVRQVWSSWWKQQSAWESRCMAAKTWRMAGIRPQNHPARRLAAAATLFSSHDDFMSSLLGFRTANPRTWHRQVTSLLASRCAIPYWKTRLTFSSAKTRKPVELIGSTRTAAIVSNILIPFLAARGLSVASLLDQLPPEQDNALIRQTAHLLFGRDHNPALYRNGLRQQGLLQVFHDFCLNMKPDCRNCALLPSLQR